WGRLAPPRRDAGRRGGSRGHRGAWQGGRDRSVIGACITPACPSAVNCAVRAVESREGGGLREPAQSTGPRQFGGGSVGNALRSHYGWLAIGGENGGGSEPDSCLNSQ